MKDEWLGNVTILPFLPLVLFRGPILFSYEHPPRLCLGKIAILGLWDFLRAYWCLDRVGA
jgi:hypothetical protein